MDTDPFQHVPVLAGMIRDPQESFFRRLDTSILDQKLADRGVANWRRSDEEREATRQTTLAGRFGEDLWVFAYGSLMWDPAFYFVEVRRATVDGYRRRFCLRSQFGRGTPEKPGLMAALDTGGLCHGLAFRIDSRRIEEETGVIWLREMILRSYQPRFVDVATPQGAIEALAFTVDHGAKNYLPNLTLEQTAGYIATGAGFLGENFEYLDNLASHASVLEIDDEELFALHALATKLRDDIRANESVR